MRRFSISTYNLRSIESICKLQAHAREFMASVKADRAVTGDIQRFARFLSLDRAIWSCLSPLFAELRSLPKMPSHNLSDLWEQTQHLRELQVAYPNPSDQQMRILAAHRAETRVRFENSLIHADPHQERLIATILDAHSRLMCKRLQYQNTFQRIFPLGQDY